MMSNKLSRKVKNRTIKELKEDYSNAIEKKLSVKYKYIYKRLGMIKLYDKITEQNKKDDVLKEFLDADKRFHFECKAYTMGYQKVISLTIPLLRYIKGILYKYIGSSKNKIIDQLEILILSMETDIAFGFFNEYKLKFRYFIDLIVFLTTNKKASSNFEKFIINELKNIIRDSEVISLIQITYYESNNFIHPNIYGYYSILSDGYENINSYIQIKEIILENCLLHIIINNEKNNLKKKEYMKDLITLIKYVKITREEAQSNIISS